MMSRSDLPGGGWAEMEPGETGWWVHEPSGVRVEVDGPRIQVYGPRAGSPLRVFTSTDDALEEIRHRIGRARNPGFGAAILASAAGGAAMQAGQVATSALLSWADRGRRRRPNPVDVRALKKKHLR